MLSLCATDSVCLFILHKHSGPHCLSDHTYLPLVLFVSSACIFARGGRPTAHGNWLQETDRDAHASGQNDDHGEEVDDEEEEDEESSSETVRNAWSVH